MYYSGHKFDSHSEALMRMKLINKINKMFIKELVKFIRCIRIKFHVIV